MEIPGDLLYTKEHLWLKRDRDCVVCGITDHAQELLDEISFIELPEKRSEIMKDDILATIESLKSVFDVLSPIRGKVSEINETLKEKPSLINNFPYTEGWIVKLIKMNEDDFKSLLNAEQYTDFIS